MWQRGLAGLAGKIEHKKTKNSKRINVFATWMNYCENVVGEKLMVAEIKRSQKS